jgi:hypothetical protein
LFLLAPAAAAGCPPSDTVSAASKQLAKTVEEFLSETGIDIDAHMGMLPKSLRDRPLSDCRCTKAAPS